MKFQISQSEFFSVQFNIQNPITATGYFVIQFPNQYSYQAINTIKCQITPTLLTSQDCYVQQLGLGFQVSTKGN